MSVTRTTTHNVVLLIYTWHPGVNLLCIEEGVLAINHPLREAIYVILKLISIEWRWRRMRSRINYMQDRLCERCKIVKCTELQHDPRTIDHTGPIMSIVWPAFDCAVQEDDNTSVIRTQLVFSRLRFEQRISMRIFRRFTKAIMVNYTNSLFVWATERVYFKLKLSCINLTYMGYNSCHL